MPFAATQPFAPSLPTFEPSGVGIPVRVQDPEQEVLHRTLVRTLAVMAASCLLLLLAIAFLTPEAWRETWVVAALGLASVVLLGLLRRQRIGARSAAHALVTALVLSAALAVLSYGSVRTSGSHLFLASVVAAGVFLGQRQMLLVLAIDVLLLSALTLAELHGLLFVPADGMQVGLRAWLTHSAILTGTGVMLMYAMSMRRDLTTRVQQELERRRSADAQRDLSLARFGRIFQASPVALVAQSMRTGTILDVNPAFVALLGYRREELLGRTDVFLWQNPAERQARVEQLLMWRRVERSFATLHHADGHAVPVHLTSELEHHPQDRLLVTLIEPVTTGV
jgi:PAS domain S-box-containing protein